MRHPPAVPTPAGIPSGTRSIQGTEDSRDTGNDAASARIEVTLARLAGALALAVAVTGSSLGIALITVSPAGADTTLGGFTVAAMAEASTASYEQPNLPIPATPSVELDEGYASTTDNFGPTGTATASTLYPGQVLANAGPELSSLEPGLPLPAAPVWPIEATSGYPQSPNTASTDKPGVTMETNSSAAGNTATASLGNAGSGSASGSGLGLGSLATTASQGSKSAANSGSGTKVLAATSSIASIATSSGTATSGATGSAATGTATATDTGISMLGGLITIGSITSTATATSDGTHGSLSGSTTVGSASVDGQAVTIDSSGVHVAGQSTPANPLLPTAEALLSQLGITMTVTNPTDSVEGSEASRQLDGLRIQVDLTTFDKQAQVLDTIVPASILAELPVPLPDAQTLVWDMGTVSVSSTAEPAYDAGAAPGSISGWGSTGASGNPGSADDAGAGGSFGPGSSFGTAGTAGTFGTPGTPGTPATADGGPNKRRGGSEPNLGAADTSSVTPLFKGIGAGVILLAVLGAGALAWLSSRADPAGAGEGAGEACLLAESEGGPVGYPDDDDPPGDAQRDLGGTP